MYRKIVYVTNDETCVELSEIKKCGTEKQLIIDNIKLDLTTVNKSGLELFNNDKT